VREIECTRWFIGRCVVLCVQVGWFVGGGNECKSCGGGLDQVRVCWETEGFLWKLSDSCHQKALHEVDTDV
jgi:hypothetical protein